MLTRDWQIHFVLGLQRSVGKAITYSQLCEKSHPTSLEKFVGSPNRQGKQEMTSGRLQNNPIHTSPGDNDDVTAGLNMCESSCSVCICMCVSTSVCGGFLCVALGDCSINSCAGVTSSNDRMTETCSLLSVKQRGV